MPSSQRPFFLSSFLAAFRQQTPATASLAGAAQPSKTHTHAHQASASAGARSMSTSPSAGGGADTAAGPPAAMSSSPGGPGGVMSQLQPIHSPRAHGMPIPGGGGSSPGARRRGSDSSSEGFRDVIGGEKWYIGGRTAGGEEKFFKLGVVRRVRSNDRLSLDRLSL